MFSSDSVRRIVVSTIAPRRVFGVITAGGVAFCAITHPGFAATTLSKLDTAVTCAATSACVSGTNTKSGPGVSGSSSSGTGVSGKSTSSHGVEGISSTSSGVFGQTSSGTAGVLGSTVSSYGVEGFATSESTLKPGIGVYGSVYTGTGVYGATSNLGIDGEATGTGVSGVASNAGNSNTGTGVYGKSDSCDAYANCGFGIGVAGQGHTIGVEAISGAYGTALVGYNSGTLGSGMAR